MFTVRRWWDRVGSRVFVVGVVLSTAWFVRQTQGAVIVEAYHWLVRPLQTSPTTKEELTNARVLELEQRLIEAQQQNQQLQSLLDYVEGQQQASILAPIVGRSSNHWWQQVTLGKGSQDGVKIGSVVMGIGGLVGKITSVTTHTSRVLLVSDPTSQVGVTISRSRYMGFMKGDSEQKAIIQFFDKVPDVRPGDMVTTSPVSKLFPSGLPIGRIQSVDFDQSPAPEAIIKLTAPISNLEWVVVHTFQPRE